MGYPTTNASSWLKVRVRRHFLRCKHSVLFSVACRSTVID